MAVEVFANSPTTVVTSGGSTAPVSGTQETWVVQSSASFPAASSSATPPTQFHIVDTVLSSEVILVTNVSGTTWTVTRGAESSTPISHAADFTIFQVATAGFLNTVMTTVAAGLQTVATSATISTMPPSGIYPLTASGAATGLIMATVSTYSQVTLVNQSTFTLTFATVATSNVADGATLAIPALASRVLTYDVNTNLWYRAA